MPLTAWLPSYDLALSCNGTRNDIDTLSSGKNSENIQPLNRAKPKDESPLLAGESIFFFFEFCVLRS